MFFLYYLRKSPTCEVPMYAKLPSISNKVYQDPSTAAIFDVHPVPTTQSYICLPIKAHHDNIY